MKFFNRLGVSVCVVLLPTAILAQDVYKCDFREAGTRGWISNWAWVHVENGTASVLDGVIRYELDGAVTPKKLKSSDGADQFTWSVKLKSRNQQQFLAKYALKLVPEAKNKSSMSMTLNNSRTQREFARGTCKKQNPVSRARFNAWAKDSAAEAKK